MTTPDTPPALAALYAERARLAYKIETNRALWSERAGIWTDYQAVQERIALHEAQWPTRWVRPPGNILTCTKLVGD